MWTGWCPGRAPEKLCGFDASSASVAVDSEGSEQCRQLICKIAFAPTAGCQHQTEPPTGPRIAIGFGPRVRRPVRTRILARMRIAPVRAIRWWKTEVHTD